MRPLTNTPRTRAVALQPARLPTDDEKPRHHKRALKPRRKKYGIEQWSDWFQSWRHCRRWYTTEAARDKALADLIKHTRNLLREFVQCPDTGRWIADVK